MDTNATAQVITYFSLSPDWVTALATIILVFATCVYVYFSYRLTKETVKLREVETSPLMSIYFDTSPVSKFKLIIKNIGKAPAYNIRFELDEKYSEHFNYNFKNTISYFAPNQEIQTIGSGYKELDALGIDNIPIVILYESKDGVQIKETFHMEWKYLSQTLLGIDEVENARRALDNIEKELKSINKTLQTKRQKRTM